MWVFALRFYALVNDEIMSLATAGEAAADAGTEIA